VARYVGRLTWLDIGGGEPFLREDLARIVGLFQAGAVSVPTNGFDPERIEGMSRQVQAATRSELTLAVSLDGFEATNDEIRGRGSFGRALETVKRLQQAGFRVKVNTVLCQRNAGELIEFMKFVRGLGVAFHSVIFLRGQPQQADYVCPRPEELEALKPGILAAWAAYDYGVGALGARVLRSYQRQMYESAVQAMREQRQVPACLAGRKHLVVYANGEVAFCETLAVLGSLRAQPLADILRSAEAERQRRMIAGGGCWCHHNCNLLDNYFLNPWRYPKLLAGALRP